MIRKRLLLVNLLALLLIAPGYGQSAESEQVVIFRFLPEKNMFYTSVGSNASELQRLYNLVEQYRWAIEHGDIPVYINGYCTSLNSEQENMKTASIRSNRVKSELITNKGLMESHFVTNNHATAYQEHKDAVTVTLHIPQATPISIQTQEEEDIVDIQIETREVQGTQPQPQAQEESGPQANGEPQMNEEALPVLHSPLPAQQQFTLRTNLLHWVAGVPNVGFEYKPTKSIGLLLNGGWSHWTGETASKQHRVWYIAPELRYYLGDAKKRWYLGLEGHAGQFNLKLNDTGRQADFIGGGLTGGYKLTLSRVFDLDFNIGFGYAELMDYEKYTQTNGVYVRTQPTETKDYWGLTQAGISLVWKINN